MSSQGILDYCAATEAIEPAAVQRVAVPVIRQRAEPHPWVLAMIADGSLDFLDRKHLPPGQKEPKMARKKIGRPTWLPKKK